MTEVQAKKGGRETRNGDRANAGMRAQFFGTMQATLTRIDVSEAPDRIKELYEKAHAILFSDDDPASTDSKIGWNRAYSVEKMLAHLRPAASLPIELNMQINFLKRAGHPAWEQYDIQRKQLFPGDLVKPPIAPAVIPPVGPDVAPVPPAPIPDGDLYKWLDQTTLSARELLERVLNDLHWQSAQRYHKRGIIGEYTKLIFYIGGSAAAIFLAVLMLIGFGKISLSPWAGMALVVVSGVLGAIFSILINPASRNIKASIEDLLRWTSPQAVSLRLCVGAIAAVILYFFFEAGLVEGVVFPDLEKIGFIPVDLAKGLSADAPKEATEGKPLGALVPNSELCKLMIWSFVAGFSEQLVARVLRGVDETTEEKKS